MEKSAVFACVGLCLLVGQAFGGEDSQPAETVAVATASGLYVKAGTSSTHAAISRGNVYSSAINTGGVVRATEAVTINGRVILRASRPVNAGGIYVARARAVAPANGSPKHHSEGLGAILARIFGQT